MGASTKATGPLAGQVQNSIRARNMAIREGGQAVSPGTGSPAFGKPFGADVPETAPGLEARPEAFASVPAPVTSPYGMSPGIGQPSAPGQEQGQQRMKQRGRSGIIFGPGRAARIPDQGSPEYEQLLQRVRGVAQM